MKTKKEREKLSRARQRASQQIAIWTQKVKELRCKIASDPGPEDQERLLFCSTQLKIAHKTLKNLNKGCALQQTWVKG